MTQGQKIIKILAIALAVFIIAGIFSGIAGLLSFIYFVTDGETGPAHDLSSYNVSDVITELDIDISASQFIIERGDSFSVWSNHEYLNIEENGTELKIYDTKRPFSNNDTDNLIVLSVPMDFSFTDVDFSTGAGKVDISELKTNELDLTLGAGEATLSDVTVITETNIEGGAGNLIIENSSFNNLNLDLGVGESTFFGELLGNSEINCGVGSTNITLEKSDTVDYKISVDKGIGAVTVDGTSVTDGQVIGSGNNLLDISCGIGDVKIELVKK